MKAKITVLMLLLSFSVNTAAETTVSEKPPVTLPNILGDVLYENDFENDSEPGAEEFGGSNSLKITDNMMIGSSQWTNYDFDFNITVVEDTPNMEDELIFMKFRYVDENNYYYLSYRRPESAVVLRRVQNGRTSWLSNPALYIGENYTQRFRIEVFGEKIRLYQKSLCYPEMDYPCIDFTDTGTSILSGGVIIEKPSTAECVYVDNIKAHEIINMYPLGERTRPQNMLEFKENPADQFEDIDNCSGKNAIRLLAGKGIVEGFCCRYYRPYYNISVGDMLIMAKRALNYDDDADLALTGISDISGGYPARAATRYEAAQTVYDCLVSRGEDITLASSMDISDYDLIPPDYRLPVSAMYGCGIMTGDENKAFNGEEYLTREAAAVVFSRLTEESLRVNTGYVIVNPKEYERAFKNPLKGFSSVAKNKYTTIHRQVIYWSQLEERASDGVEKIIEFCDESWAGYPERNIKVSPQIVLDGVQNGTYWPEDMREYDYSSPQFLERVDKLIQKLGIAWDNDPRVAYIITAIFGKWGESASPLPTLEAQETVGNAFKKYFKNKVVVAHGGLWLYTNFDFGVNWDSYGHFGNTFFYDYLAYSDKYKDRWKTAPWGGEAAFDWGDMVGSDPDDSVLNYLDWWLQVLRYTHCTYIGWVAGYDDTVPEISANGEIMQKNIGYRYVMEQVQYPPQIKTGEDFTVKLAVKNVGVAPMYYNFALCVSLLDKNTGEVVYQDNFKNTDIRKWLPDDDYSEELLYSEEGTFTLPEAIPDGEYIIALSINDVSGGNVPSVRFANTNYFNGGRHPIGIIGVNCMPSETKISENDFDDIYSDDSLYYIYDKNAVKTESE